LGKGAATREGEIKKLRSVNREDESGGGGVRMIMQGKRGENISNCNEGTDQEREGPAK